jgi:hypothetical protein
MTIVGCWTTLGRARPSKQGRSTRWATRNLICPAAAHARQHKDAGVFVPEGPDDGSDSTELAEVQAFHAWLPSFRPSGTKARFLMLTRIGSCRTATPTSH